MEVGGLWEAAKHSQFEAALKAHPRVAGEPGELRWQRIAAMVSGASAAECQQYFRLVRARLKQQQQQQQQQQVQQQVQQQQPASRGQRREQAGSRPAAADPPARQPAANTAPAPAAMRPMRQRVVQHWWQRLEDEDPISLEPIAELSYAPFELPNEIGGEQATWFDGRVLAHYLVSTGKFEHPITRRELQAGECRKLDSYLLSAKLGPGRVLEAFERRSEYKADADGNIGAMGLQAEASTLLHALFENSARGRGRGRVAPGGGNDDAGRGRGRGAGRGRGRGRGRPREEERSAAASREVVQREASGSVSRDGGLVVVDEDGPQAPDTAFVRGVFCTACTFENPSGSHECEMCGARLPTSDEQTPAASRTSADAYPALEPSTADLESAGRGQGRGRGRGKKGGGRADPGGSSHGGPVFLPTASRQPKLAARPAEDFPQLAQSAAKSKQPVVSKWTQKQEKVSLESGVSDGGALVFDSGFGSAGDAVRKERARAGAGGKAAWAKPSSTKASQQRRGKAKRAEEPSWSVPDEPVAPPAADPWQLVPGKSASKTHPKAKRQQKKLNRAPVAQQSSDSSSDSDADFADVQEAEPAPEPAPVLQGAAQQEALAEKNKRLVKLMLAEGGAEKVQSAKQLSQRFRKNELTAERFIDEMTRLFGAESLDKFADLLTSLLKKEEKQQKLRAAVLAFRSRRFAASRRAQPASATWTCSSCSFVNSAGDDEDSDNARCGMCGAASAADLRAAIASLAA